MGNPHLLLREAASSHQLSQVLLPQLWLPVAVAHPERWTLGHCLPSPVVVKEAKLRLASVWFGLPRPHRADRCLDNLHCLPLIR